MINFDLKKIKAMVFDVDGVLSDNNVNLFGEDGQPYRTANIKDGYALHLAATLGFPMAVITGGRSIAVKARYEALGLHDVFMGVSKKTDTFKKWCADINVKPENVLYMGDDIPDYEVMRLCGCPVCPVDAAAEIRSMAVYISPIPGGHGCVRDVVEQVLKAQGKWMADADAFGW